MANKRDRVFERYNGRCVYCGSFLHRHCENKMYQKRNGDIDIKCLGQGKCYHIDHIIPKSKNGTNKENNLVASCPRCNAIKGTRNLVEFLNKCIQTKRDLEEKLENTYKRIDKIKELRGKINYE